jgi:hypothetical protein
MNSLSPRRLIKKYIPKTFWVLSIGVVNPEGFILDPDPDPSSRVIPDPVLGPVKDDKLLNQ